MNDTDIDQLGPVDHLVIEFARSLRRNGAQLVADGCIPVPALLAACEALDS